ncbi:MAG: hypothetical protein IJ655_10530 [Lachnospiraceae bacterium]|nr:hypothetical protein [Lachnospiraceae bacterium]MBR1573168.1 hypothetical protein [Lachnospiraceae bacterium]
MGFVVFSFVISICFMAIGIFILKLINKDILPNEYKKLPKEGKKFTLIVFMFGIFFVSAGLLLAAIGVSSIKYANNSPDQSQEITEEQINDLNYYKKNGKWYYQGDGAY